MSQQLSAASDAATIGLTLTIRERSSYDWEGQLYLEGRSIADMTVWIRKVSAQIYSVKISDAEGGIYDSRSVWADNFDEVIQVALKLCRKRLLPAESPAASLTEEG